MAASVIAVELFIVCLSLFLLHRLVTARCRAPLPPGPKGLPFIGNALQMPTEQPWKVYAEWSHIYGDITYTSVLGQPIVIINSTKAALDLLDKKSLIYSDRPHLVMCGELVGWQDALPCLPYGHQLRLLRKLLHRVMGTKASVQQFDSIMEEEAGRFLKMVLERPKDLQAHIRRSIGAVILKISYGYTVKQDNDPIVNLAERGMDEFSELVIPGAFLIDLLPILKHVPEWFPGGGFKTKAKAFAKTRDEMVHVPYNYSKNEMTAGTMQPSFVSMNLKDGHLTPQEELDLQYAATALYGGGADTTVSAIYTFFLTMTLNPSVQTKAQAELDALIGGERLPTLADRASLPYIDAIVKEVFRWHPVAPLGLPHASNEDGVYNGYLIPKGSILVANIWQVLHDPHSYSDPMTFNPGRYLPASAGGKEEPDPRTLVFGFGRRVCPGMNLADSSLFIYCARTLAVFNISKSLDKSGIVIEPVVEYTSATISHPRPFQCDVKPRSVKAEALIRSLED